jgi:hypothetical protein
MLLAANVIICESVLNEKTDVASAIRILNALTIAPAQNFATFRVHTMLTSTPMDFQQHIVKVWMRPIENENSVMVADAPEFRFVFANKLDFSGPGAFNLTTTFTLDLRPLGTLGHYFVSVSLDGQIVANAPIMLRRG